METTVKKSWKPLTAGILNILTGAMSILKAIGLIIAITAVDIWPFLMDAVPPQDLPFVAPVISTILIILLVLSIVGAVFPIIGGVFAIQRRRWGWALAGSIISIFGGFPMGIASIMGIVSTIFVAMAKDEFE